MGHYDRISAIFWLVVAVAIGEESIRLGPGSLSDPGPGLIPLGCGLVLAVFGLAVFVRSFSAHTGEDDRSWKPWRQSRRLLAVLVLLIAYALFIDLLGFSLVTLLWMIFMCRLGKISWKATSFISVVTTISSYILFEHYLGILFPRGIFGF